MPEKKAAPEGAASLTGRKLFHARRTVGGNEMTMALKR
jgi:hypothetical protein